MTKKPEIRIEIWDDEPGKSAEWKERLTDLLGDTEYKVEAPDSDALEDRLNCLIGRRKQSRAETVPEEDNHVIDHIDILFLDQDLVDLSGDGHFSTGDQLAYLARTFSRVGYIVVLNQFGTHQFDLSMVEDFASKGDLDIGDSQIANPGLWWEPFSDFRLWHWPLLPRQVEAQRRREAEVEKTLDAKTPILEFLGFDEAAIRLLDPAPAIVPDRQERRRARPGKDRLP